MSDYIDKLIDDAASPDTPTAAQRAMIRAALESRHTIAMVPRRMGMTLAFRWAEVAARAAIRTPLESKEAGVFRDE